MKKLTLCKANPKMRFRIVCPVCNRIISSDVNDRPFKVEVKKEENEDDYDKLTRCHKCNSWVGAYR